MENKADSKIRKSVIYEFNFSICDSGSSIRGKITQTMRKKRRSYA